MPKKCIIIGDPVEHSLSPAMHNAGYKFLGLEDRFVFTKRRVTKNNLQDAIKELKDDEFYGITVTTPHKVEIIKYLDKIDPIAKKIGAVNTILNKNGELTGYNTDWLGTTNPIKELTSLKNKKVALIGAGGASRAIAFGLLKEGSSLKIFNRTIQKAEQLSNKLASVYNQDRLIEFSDLSNLEEVESFDIVINSTSLGMLPNTDQTPLPKKYLNSEQIVFEAIYNPHETKFVKEAREVGCRVIFGYEMLLHQGLAQFEIYTNRNAPKEVMKEALLNNLYK